MSDKTRLSGKHLNSLLICTALTEYDVDLKPGLLKAHVWNIKFHSWHEISNTLLGNVIENSQYCNEQYSTCIKISYGEVPG